MPWPKLIQLYDSQNSTAYNGSELRATWYVEPYDAIPAFVASMLGRVEVNGTKPVRTLPAQHFLYQWCLAVQCDDLPIDQSQLSYRATMFLTPPDITLTLKDQTRRITDAVITPADSTKDIYTAGFVSANNKQFSAGGFVVVTYQPFLFARTKVTDAPVLEDADMDFVNMRFEDQERKNVPNAGLKLITPPNETNLFGLGGVAYPSAGIAPEFKEQYESFIVERRMLNPNFDLPTLSGYQNCVDRKRVVAPNGQAFHGEALRFSKYKTEYVQVPKVDQLGNVSGYSRWLNLTLYWDWRTTKSNQIYNASGFPQDDKFVTWNHVLAYPGTLSWLLTGGGVAWYYTKFSSQSIGADTPPYPQVPEVLGRGTGILDPLTINP